MDLLLLRLEAPLMSFGAPIVDQHGVIQPYPALSMLTGLLGNALGYDHAESDALERLQARLRYAAREDRKGRALQDYQTVDLGASYMDDDGAWTTRGRLEKRKGGSASSGTHIRFRDYWADAAYTVALTLTPADEAPTLDALADAVQRPARPLFIGRKPCLPSAPLFAGRTEADTLMDALHEAPLADRPRAGTDGNAYRTWWPTTPDEDVPDETRENIRQPVTDRRDWENQIHVGERWVAAGEIELSATDEPTDA